MTTTSRETGGSGRTPRVLQVALSLNPGGTERLVVDLVRHFAGQIPMAVCCLDEVGAWASELAADGVPVTALHREAGFRPILGRAIAQAAAAHAANVIHSHQYSPFVYSCLARLWRPGCRLIFTEHGRLSDVGPSPKRRLANRALQVFPREVFAVSEDLRQHIIAEGFAPSIVNVIYNGIVVGPLPDRAAREDVRCAIGASDSTFVVGTIARLDPVKDLRTLITAVSECVKQIPMRLLIVGDGPERGSLEQCAVETGAAPFVRFLGHRDDARRWLAGCDAYVNSSVSEGVSLTILEAMAAGLPVIATRVGGTPEVLSDASGRLVPPREPLALATTLRELATRRDLRESMGRAARQRVEDRFTLERMIGAYRSAYYRAA